jgi:hypothetical protein
MWGGFAIFWEASVLANHHARNTILFPLWGTPFVLVGLYLIVGRFFVRHWKLSHTTYAVTDRRALSIAPSFRGGHQESAVWLRSYPHLETRGRRGGRGTLFIGGSGLGPRALLADPGWPSFWSLKGNGIVFFDIDEPRTVYELIQSRLGRQLEQEHR